MEDRIYSLAEVKSEANDFLNRKKAINNTTFLNYRTSIKYFIYYLEDIAEVSEITSDNIANLLEDFQAILFNGFNYKVEGAERFVKVKASGVNTHVRRVKTFLNKCLKMNPELNKLPVNKPKYKSLSIEDIKLMISECSNYWSNEEIAIRTATLIKFLFNTAFRIEEALGIKTSDIFEEEGSYYVVIHEKGKAKGVLTEIAISENTYNLLHDYINIKSVPSTYVFSSVKASGNGRSKQFSRRQFNNNIIKLASYTDLKNGTNISKTVENNSSHVFRHSKATYLLNVKKEDVVTVQKVLRHSSINSTLIYLNPEEEAINKVRISNDI